MITKQSQNTIIQQALWTMVAVLLLATAFYLYDLNAISFWEDESWLAIAIDDSVSDVWQFATQRGVHPPLYFYIAFALKPFVGTSEYALRWLGGLISLLGIAWTYRLGQAVGREQRVGVWAALLVVGSIYLLYLTRLARQYTLFYTLSAWTYWLYWRWQSRPSPRLLILLCLAQTANLYTHYFSAFVALSLALHVLLTRPRQAWRLWMAFVGSGILFLPWLPSIWAQLHGDLGTGVYYAANKLKDIPENYIGRVTNAYSGFGVGFVLVGGVALWRGRQLKFTLLLLLTVIGTFIPIVIINQTLFQWYIGRNMLYTLPLVAVFYAMGLSLLWQWRAGKIAVILFVCAFIGWGLLAYPRFYPGTADWRRSMTAIACQARPTDTFVLRGEPYSTDYYLRRLLSARVSLIPMADWIAVPTLSDRIWLIDSGQAVRFEAIDQIPQTMQMTDRVVYLPIVAELYQTAPAQPMATFGDQVALGYFEQALSPQAGDKLQVDLWWQALHPLSIDYSTSLQLWQGDSLIAQDDRDFYNPCIETRTLSTETWLPQTRTLTLPDTLPPGDYRLQVTVYDWRNGTRLVTDTPDNLVTLATIHVP